MANIPLSRLKIHLADSSRKLADLTAHLAYDDPDLFNELVNLALSDEGPFAQRAARVLSICNLRYPEMISPYRKRIIRRMPSLHNEGVIRNLLKIYTETPQPYADGERSVLLNLCFDYLSSGDTAVALKVYSMEILYRISEEIPEIRHELYIVIEDKMPFGSVGYKSRGKKIMKMLMRG